MNNVKVKVTADKIDQRKRKIKLAKIASLVTFLFLLGTFIILNLVNSGGAFTVVLATDLANNSRLTIYELPDDFDFRRRLYAEGLDSMDNISIDWLPENIDSEGYGSHNGENYIAYTFFVENRGENTVNYWEEFFIDAVVKNIDEALRIMVIQNGERTVYAKVNSQTKEAEEDTIAFKDKDKIIVRPRASFAPGDIDKYTIVMWLEGSDEDCLNNLIGGEIKIHMEITDENVG